MSLIGKMKKPDENLIDRITRLIKTDGSVDAPQDSINRAKAIFRRRIVEPKKSVVQKFLAVLQMDLSPNKMVFGERSASALPARQMLFSAGETGIDLRIAESTKGFTVRGQILGEDFARCKVRFNEFETIADELGEFSFSDISSGIYDLTLQTDESEITIENLEI